MTIRVGSAVITLDTEYVGFRFKNNDIGVFINFGFIMFDYWK